MRSNINTSRAPGAIGPYSQGICAGGFIFVSGQLPVDTKSGEIPEGIVSQTEQSLRNVRAILEVGRCTMKDVVEVSVFLKDMNDFAEMNKVYERFFEAPYPARVVVEAAGLPMDVSVEIRASAVGGDSGPLKAESVN